MRKLRAAIIGCGRISACYADAFQRLSDMVDVVYAVDKDSERARAFAKKFDCKYASDFDQIPEEADEMLRVERETGRKLGVIFQTRYTKGVEMLKQMIANGCFGKITAARSYLTWDRPKNYYAQSDWKGTWDKEGGGVLIDQAIHSIDRVRYMLGDDVEWVNGSIHNYAHSFVRVEDSANAAVMFQNGCLYNLYACNIYGANSPITIEFLGEKGRCGLIQDMGFYELDGVYAEIRNAYEDTAVGPNYWGSSHHLQIRDFYQSILTDTPVRTDGMEGRKTLEIIKGIYLSSLKGERVSFPFEDVRYMDLNKAAKGPSAMDKPR